MPLCIGLFSDRPILCDLSRVSARPKVPERHGKAALFSTRTRPLQSSQAVDVSPSDAALKKADVESLPFVERQDHSKQAFSNGEHSSESRGQKLVLHYSTGWSTAVIHYSMRGGAWTDKGLQLVASSNGQWMVVDFEIGQQLEMPEAPLLEFVLHNGRGDWDKPLAGGNYVIDAAGRYSISNGEVSAVESRAILVASDLDDTMVGDDLATAEFKAFWESQAVMRGSRLVYNTGRALDKWLALIREKAWCLAVPDYLICSVGTKLYCTTTKGWVADPTFEQRLGEDWDLHIVREAAYKCLAQVGRERMHFRPPDEQNEHKITCGVHVDALPEVLQQMEASLQAEGLKARLAVSGKGEWRFLDIVSRNAGKHAALECVRKKLGFEPKDTVACGDSGNDIDMLAGENLAIVVGNAQPDLREWLAQQQHQPKHNSHAGPQPRIVLAKKHMAAGVLEGLALHNLL